RQLGWQEVIVIDDDLGRSGSGVSRPGFERLLVAICEGRAGAVFAIEASRLARNGRDWHTLIEFCGLVDLRWAGDDIKRMRALARELVGLQPGIIVAATAAPTVALQRETRTIPIVFINVADPVAQRIVPRLDRPSGNITGFGNFEATLAGKWLELLSEIA